MSTLRQGRFFATPDKRFNQDLSAGALDETLEWNTPVKIDQIRFKASVPITEIIKISIDSKQGANYDAEMRKLSLSAADSATWNPDEDLYLRKGDKLRIQCTNANATGIIYGEPIASEG